MRLHLFSFFFLILCTTVQTNAQSAQKFINQQSVGNVLQIGIPYYDLPEGDRYTPIIVGMIYHIPFWKSKTAFNVTLGFMPHFAIGFSDSQDHELGVNVIISANWEVAQHSMLSFRAASGPHFVTIQTRKQIEGYIFSDNFFLTYRHRFGQYNIGASIGWRHMSNAEIAQPNGGIDNYLIGLEFGLLID